MVSRDDIDIIPLLNDKGRNKLFSFLEKKDCNLFSGFKVSRSYYRQLRSDKPIPLAPAGWNIDFLTSQEWKRYVDILENAPW